MLKDISYKRKVLYGGILFVLMLLASYKKNFKDIFELTDRLEQLNKIGMGEDASYSIMLLKNEIDEIENVIGSVVKEPEEIQQELLNFITQSKQDVSIEELKELHRSSSNDFLVSTQQIILKGDYKNLISLINELETDFETSRIVNVEFTSVKNFRKKKIELFVEITFQNYEKN